MLQTSAMCFSTRIWEWLMGRWRSEFDVNCNLVPNIESEEAEVPHRHMDRLYRSKLCLIDLVVWYGGYISGRLERG